MSLTVNLTTFSTDVLATSRFGNASAASPPPDVRQSHGSCSMPAWRLGDGATLKLTLRSKRWPLGLRWLNSHLVAQTKLGQRLLELCLQALRHGRVDAH